tara:strand:+ start:170 stop:589 length:420 start_codon:yes stop_codon:yes gene_type:complete
MPVIKRSSQSSRRVVSSSASSASIKKKEEQKVSPTQADTTASSIKKKVEDTSTAVPSAVFPTKIRDMNDTSFGTLDSTKDGQLVSYSTTNDKFVLITADDVLVESVADDDLPDAFADQLNDEIDITITSIDGGSFSGLP